MGKELFMCYWICEETYGTLNTLPAYVDIAPVFYATISDDYYLLEFKSFATPINVVQGWVKTVQANKTKVLLSINDSKLGTIPADKLDAFVDNVVATVDSWGLDGLDFDYEPPNFGNGQGANLINLVSKLRSTLKPGAMLTMPIYSGWLGSDGENALKGLNQYIDYFATMDYTGYPGYGSTISACESYAKIVTWQKLLIGMSCMGPYERSWITPYEDIAKLAKYEPQTGDKCKAGAMLYTFNYDRRERTSTTNPGTGTGYSNLSWTEAVHANLP